MKRYVLKVMTKFANREIPYICFSHHTPATCSGVVPIVPEKANKSNYGVVDTYVGCSEAQIAE